MEKQNHLRRDTKSHPLFRLLAMLLVTGALWWYYQHPQENEVVQVLPQDVAKAFAAQVVPEAAAGQTLLYVAFHREFSGTEGEAFYAVRETAELGPVVEKYHIAAADEPPGYTFVYKAVFEELALPDSQFIFFTEEDGQWVEKDKPQE